MEYLKTGPAQEQLRALQTLRHILDKQPVGSRHESRIANLLGFCMLSELPPTDTAYGLQNHIPKGENLQKWYAENRPVVNQLRSEDKHDYFTDRYDLELDSERFKYSIWMHNMHYAALMMPYNKEVLNADIAMKLLYQQAANQQPHNPAIQNLD